MSNQADKSLTPYLSPVELGAFSIGTSIGWGSLAVTCSSYLSKAGIVGSVLGMVLGGVLMLVIGRCYVYLIRGFPDAGGTYAFVRELFGNDYGYLTAWFLALAYLSVFWANVTSLPLFARLNRVVVGAIVIVSVLYILVLLLSVSAYPERYATWFDYISNLDNLSGLETLPAFFAASRYLGDTGVALLATSLLALVASSLVGNICTLSRLGVALGRDGILPRKNSELNQRHVPQHAILLVGVMSLVVPFVGRAALGWIVDVTSFGAIAIYALIAASAIKLARTCGDRSELIIGYVGLAIMLVFAVQLLLPTLFNAGGVESESYFLFAAWSVLGLLYFRIVLNHDGRKHYGKTVVVWIALIALILFSSVDWMNELTLETMHEVVEDIRVHYREHGGIYKTSDEEEAFIEGELAALQSTNSRATLVFAGLFATAIGILASNYAFMRRRADATEEALNVTRNIVYRDALTGVRNKQAFTELEDELDQQLSTGEVSAFAIVVFDINGLKYVNDTFGHKAGDEYIRSGCAVVCKLYKHSPVFRIGGDEFVAVLTSDDYQDRDALLAQFNQMLESRIGTDEVVLSAGMCTYDPARHTSVREVFDEADQRMYHRKQELKDKGVRTR